jgi:hypothetical protein
VALKGQMGEQSAAVPGSKPTHGVRSGLARPLLGALLLTSMPEAVNATPAWYFSSAVQSIYTDYSGTDARAALTGWGMFISADYFESGGVTVGYNARSVDRDAQPAVDEKHSYLSARVTRYVDATGGRVTVRVDRHRVDDRTPDVRDIGTATGARVAYLANRSTYYVDLGYTVSNYAADDAFTDDIQVRQYTPTCGFPSGTNDWTQLRAFFITHDESNRIAESRPTRALELKWTHRLAVRDLSGFDQFAFTALFGERMYAVDPDSADMYSVSDLQKATFGGTLRWRWSADTSIVLAVGTQRFENVRTSERYSGSFFYLNGSKSW